MQISPLKSINTSRLTILLAIFVLLATNSLTPLLSPNGDNVSYIALAKNLLNGQGYTNTFYPGFPPESQYPPLLPVILIPLLLVVGENYLIMKIIPLIFGVLGLAAMYRVLQKTANNDMAWITILLTAINAHYIFYSSSILTETLYVFLSACSLLIVCRIEQSKNDRFGLIIIASLLIALSFYARTIGATLALSTCGYLFFRKRYKASILLATLIGLFLLPWAVRSLMVQNSYFGQLTEQSANEPHAESFIVFYRLAYNLPRFVGKVMIDLIGGPAISQFAPYNPLKMAGSAVLSAIFLFGYFRSVKTRLTPINSYVLVYMGILAVWPYHDSRFFLPILPLIILYILQGFQHLPALNQPLRQRVLTWGIAVLFLFCSGTSLYQIYFNRTVYYQPEIAHFKEACLWVKSHTPADALIISRKPRLAANWAERKSWWYKNPEKIPKHDDMGNPIRVTHLIVTEFPITGVNLGEGLKKMRESNPSRFQLLYQTQPPTVSVYALHTP